ncbi:alpha/beta-hydrolase, partial [Marasmius fiardii PR-910]
LVLLYTLIISPFSGALRKKRLRRLLFEAYIRYVLRTATARQAQWAVGTTTKTYKKWAGQWGIEPLLEDVPESGRKLMWIGNKNAEKIVFYVHGGGFRLAISDYMFTFWLYIQHEYARKTGGKELAIVAMEYSIYPHTFPMQLTEIIYALSYILNTCRISPSNLTIAGDSAGANLILQLVSHTLNPLPVSDGIPCSPLIRNQPISGTLLISPWLSLGQRTSSHAQNDGVDCIASDSMIWNGSMVLAGVPADHVPYMKVLSAGERWFDGIDELMNRVFVTVGGAECLLDDGIGVYEKIKASVSRGRRRVEVEVDVEDGGIHEDMMIEFAAGGKKLTAVGEKVVEWLMHSSSWD